MAGRSDFGRDWGDVERTWCLGHSLALAPTTAWEAMGHVERLSPTLLDPILAGPSRGPYLVAWIVDLGISLGLCESLDGFAGVLSRLASGEGSALSEMMVAARLVRLGYTPTLEPQLVGKRPD